ncbi:MULTISPECIES: propane 2-monooxygenase effector subunit MimD [unclassified Amycolatopsis]|uniref:MmoB/DmpM family protein n=1 Tax=Amycolatopsis carbonis TaxID=715471 RepID=A0A9Y2MRS8_9PSEU|nr:MULTISPECIES: MmoB/DmpM family protein [unclassified Amycolatopsis]QYN20012.1 MmoB/DmpM family protein [Amycolatopsis sp. DSM 110486]WIX75821.1 MmoB/DmpM family protein [Amycolatopsis sp. 2-15]
MTASRQFSVDRTASNMCGVTLMNNQNGYVVAEVMRSKPGITVAEYPSMIRLDGTNKIVFNWDEISEAIGFDFGQTDFEEIMSTHYGRMVHLDDETVLFANPEDAAEYIDFDLEPVE